MVRFSVESGKKDGDGGSREKTRRLFGLVAVCWACEKGRTEERKEVGVWGPPLKKEN